MWCSDPHVPVVVENSNEWCNSLQFLGVLSRGWFVPFTDRLDTFSGYPVPKYSSSVWAKNDFFVLILRLDSANFWKAFSSPWKNSFIFLEKCLDYYIIPWGFANIHIFQMEVQLYIVLLIWHLALSSNWPNLSLNLWHIRIFLDSSTCLDVWNSVTYHFV